METNIIWYLTRDYYMWLNFLPIFDKEEKKYGFAKGKRCTISYGTYMKLLLS